jgi:hypothetical protein
MSDLRAWLAARSRRAAAVPLLEESLLGRRFGAYARHRLVGFAATRVAAVAVALVEYVLLAALFDGKRLVGSLVVANACQLAAAFAWGALEPARTRLRGLDKPAATRELSRWLGAAALAAALALAAGAALLLRDATPAGLYALACLVRLAADLFARTLYSGIYARRRVHRPIASLLAAELVGLGAVAAAAPRLGPWSFGAGLILAVAVSRGLAIRYTLRAYRRHRIPVPRPRLGRLGPASVLLVAGASGAMTRAASALVLIFLVASAPARGVGLLLHVVGPVLVAASTWPQVFYPDLKRLDGAGALLGARLERALVGLGAALGPLFALSALGAAGWAGLEVGARLALAIAAVAAGLALLAPLQLAAFVRGRFIALAASGLAVALGLAGAAATRGIVPFFAAVVVAAVVVAVKRPPRPRPAPTRIATLTAPRAARAFAGWLQQSGADGVELRGRRVAFASGPGEAELIAAAAGLLVTIEPAPLRPRAQAADVAPRFAALVPGGRLLDVEAGDLADLAPAARQAIWTRAVADPATTYRAGDAIRFIFIVPPEARQRWRDYLSAGGENEPPAGNGIPGIVGADGASGFSV